MNNFVGLLKPRIMEIIRWSNYYEPGFVYKDIHKEQFSNKNSLLSSLSTVFLMLCCWAAIL